MMDTTTETAETAKPQPAADKPAETAAAETVAKPTPWSPAPYVFPETLPTDEALFITNNDAKVRQKVEGRVVGLKLEKDRNDNRVVRLAIALAPGQSALIKATGEIGSLDGMVAVTTKYLTPAAAERAWANLRVCGLDPALAAQRLTDKEAVAYKAAQIAAGRSTEQIEERMTLLALQRGDLQACGLGSNLFRFNTHDDKYVNPNTGAETFTVKVQWIEAIPAPVAVDELDALAASVGASMRPVAKSKAPAKGGAAPAKGATSGAPSPKDNVEF